jgi:hypothetical protein
MRGKPQQPMSASNSEHTFLKDERQLAATQNTDRPSHRHSCPQERPTSTEPMSTKHDKVVTGIRSDIR